MFDLFLAGGAWIMSILTVELICLLFAAWKAPAWVKEIGLLVLVTDLIWQLKGMVQAAEVRTAGRRRPFDAGCPAA